MIESTMFCIAGLGAMFTSSAGPRTCVAVPAPAAAAALRLWRAAPSSLQPTRAASCDEAQTNRVARA